MESDLEEEPVVASKLPGTFECAPNDHEQDDVVITYIIELFINIRYTTILLHR